MYFSNERKFFMNKLILAEKPSTARILAHVVGAREKIYSGNSNAL